MKSLENELSQDCLLLGEKLIRIRRMNNMEYQLIIAQLKKQFGINFYNKYLKWHEKEDE